MKVRKHGDPGKILNCFRSTFAPTSYPKHGSWNKVEQSEQVVYIFFVAEKNTDLQTLNSGAETHQETFLIFHLHLFVNNYHSSQPKPRAARKHNTLNFSLVSPLHVHRANVVVFTSRALESIARLKSTGCSGATIGIASWTKCYEANRGWVTCVEAWLCSELFIPWKSYVCLSRCTIPAMSSPNSLMRQNVCPYLKQGRTLNDLLMRAARWMTDLL